MLEHQAQMDLYHDRDSIAAVLTLFEVFSIRHQTFDRTKRFAYQ